MASGKPLRGRMLLIKTVSLEFVLFLFVVVQCKGPPAIIGTIKSEYTIGEGRTVKLRCKVSGTNEPLVNRTLTAWKKLPNIVITKKFSRFKMRIGRYLKITKVKVADQGTYLCIAYNPYGKIKREIKLVVQASNTSIRTPTPNSISPTASVSMSARDSTRTTKLPKTKGSLRSSIPLIDGHPPKFRNPSNRSSEYAHGLPIKLKCRAYEEASLNITWLKNGKRLGRGYRKLLKSRGWVLNFRQLSSNDAGTYTCIVTNPFGSSVKTFVIKVVGLTRTIQPPVKPVILEGVLKNETATKGGDVTFVCSAFSTSYPNFHFLKWRSAKNVSNGSEPYEFIDFGKSKFEEIRETAKPHIGNRQVYTHHLVIRNVTSADEAKYTCVVGSTAGWVSEHAFLAVLKKDSEGDGGRGKRVTTSKAPRNTGPQLDQQIMVDEVPLAALIGVPIAVVILLIGTIVWCYFMTRKHYSGQHWKCGVNQSLPQEEKNAGLSPQFYAARKGETRNVSFNVYVDCPNDIRVQPDPIVQLSRTPYDMSESALKGDPPLDGLIVHQERPWTNSNRTNHRKRHERKGLELSESSESEMECSGV